jgi:flavin reductase (DIM6/NTAB) family NADH-FMN oxidoreductase RutF
VPPVTPPPEQVDLGAFRRAAGRFATGICVVSTRVDGHDHAMTVNAFASVSLDPLLVLVCVETEARFHDAILEAGTWGVSILDSSARSVAAWLATRGRPLQGQLDRIPFTPGPLTGAPLLEASLATMECRTEAVYPGGDHSVVLGRVLAVDARDRDSGALIYYRGGYGTLQ